MRGDFVIVRAFGDIPLVRIVWDETDKIIYITNEEQYALLSAGKPALEPVGFPWEDVFIYDEEMANAMKRLINSGKWDWSNLVNCKAQFTK